VKSVGIFEAKARFSALVADAMSGKSTIVTKNGKPVAQVGPVQAEASRGQVAAERLSALRRRLSREGKLKGVDIRSLIDEGRR
jgi:prevent-host-death family protein